jgi:hypothetical protein
MGQRSNITVGAGAGAASRYGYGSAKMMRVLSASSLMLTVIQTVKSCVGCEELCIYAALITYRIGCSIAKGLKLIFSFCSFLNFKVY